MEGCTDKSERSRIIVLGSGNVATSLAPALSGVGDVVQVWSRDLAHASVLAAGIDGAVAVDKAENLDMSADFAIIAVSDDAVADVAAMLYEFDGIVAHTSGSVAIDKLGKCRYKGVLYPLQTFSRQRPLSVADVPFFIEGDSTETYERLATLASSLSERVYQADSRHRAALHIAAVFASNFANYLWDISDNLLRPYGYDFTVFGPLLSEALAKAVDMGPHRAQTGPAMRGDAGVMNSHLNKLPVDLAKLYEMLSDMIIRAHVD